MTIIAALRGALLLLAPGTVTTIAGSALQSPFPVIVAGIVTTVLGLWLSYVGWLTAPHHEGSL